MSTPFSKYRWNGIPGIVLTATPDRVGCHLAGGTSLLETPNGRARCPCLGTVIYGAWRYKQLQESADTEEACIERMCARMRTPTMKKG